jgi:septal ring factor EnvC (AmiA/AmiB activator)
METQAEMTAVNRMNQSSEGIAAPQGKVLPKKRGRSIRIPLKWLVSAGAVVGIIAGLSISIASNYLSIMIRQARDGFVVYRLASERDELRATKQRLERELSSLRENHTQVSAFEETVKGRLAEINSIVEASTSLGIFKRDKRKHGARGAILAREGTQQEPNKNALAAILDSPVLSGGSRRRGRKSKDIEELRELNRGLGGAEVECRRGPTGKVVCASSVAKEEVAFTDMRAALKPGFSTLETPKSEIAQKFSGEQQELLEQLEYYTDTLRTVPIGSPAIGTITSHFGYRTSPFTHHSSRHEGVDISLQRGTRIRAPGDGIVVKAEYDGAYGWVVDLAHAGKIITRYAHLSRPLVKEGQRIRRGQVVGLSGSTGRSTGPHLHYEVRVNGLAKNPMGYIALAEKLSKTLL